jgi:hypothetical protein
VSSCCCVVRSLPMAPIPDTTMPKPWHNQTSLENWGWPVHRSGGPDVEKTVYPTLPVCSGRRPGFKPHDHHTTLQSRRHDWRSGLRAVWLVAPCNDVTGLVAELIPRLSPRRSVFCVCHKLFRHPAFGTQNFSLFPPWPRSNQRTNRPTNPRLKCFLCIPRFSGKPLVPSNFLFFKYKSSQWLEVSSLL